MIENNLIEFASRESNADPLTELLRQGARQLIAQAVEAELTVFMSAFAEHQIEHTRHRSMMGFLVNLIGGLVAYCLSPNKTKLPLSKGRMIENVTC